MEGRARLIQTERERERESYSRWRYKTLHITDGSAFTPHLGFSPCALFNASAVIKSLIKPASDQLPLCVRVCACVWLCECLAFLKRTWREVAMLRWVNFSAGKKNNVFLASKLISARKKYKEGLWLKLPADYCVTANQSCNKLRTTLLHLCRDDSPSSARQAGSNLPAQHRWVCNVTFDYLLIIIWTVWSRHETTAFPLQITVFFQIVWLWIASTRHTQFSLIKIMICGMAHPDSVLSAGGVPWKSKPF